ncbi:MAG: hypothetical protein AABP62_08365 [Planctomycetota bacterium]
MRSHLAALFLLLLPVGVFAESADQPTSTAATPAVLQLAVEKGLFYIERQSMVWWKENKCVSCHEGPMLLVAHIVAKERGVPIDQRKLDFWSERWVFKGAVTKVRKDGKTDTVGTLALPWLFLYREREQEQSASRAKAFGELFRELAKKSQAPAGDWGPDNRLNYTSWIVLSLAELEQSKLPFEPKLREEIAASRQRTETWLESQTLPSPGKTEELAGWVAYEHACGHKERARLLLDELLARQQPGGSWGMTKDEQAHNLVTGVALLSLKRCDVPNEHPAVVKAQRFLLDGQAADGRWPTKGRYFHTEREDPPVEAWASGLIVTALCATLPPLPADTKPLFTRDPKLVEETDKLALEAAEGYSSFDYEGDPTLDSP